MLFSFCLTFEDLGQQNLLSITLSKDLISLLSFDAGQWAPAAPLPPTSPALKFSLQHSLSVFAVQRGNESLGPPTDRTDQWEGSPPGLSQWEPSWRGSQGLSCGSSTGGLSLPEFAHDQLARAHTRLFALTTKLALSVWIEN